MSAIIYLLQVSACMSLFYGFYYLLLNRLTFFTINRYYLLFTLVLSFIIPLLTIPVHQQYTAAPVVQQVIQMRSLPTIPNYTFTPITAPIQTTSPITWMQLLNWSYFAAVAGLSIHLLITLFNFFIKLKRRKLSSLGKIHILRGDKKLPNGSFLNYIFLNDDALSADEMEQIVAHEMLHVKLYHSADRILMKLVQIILWFNPVVYFYARSMEENHEFEVDREVARSTDKTKYADLLLHLSVANQGMLYHSFSKVPLKKRIIMLFNKPSAKVKRVVYVLVLPVILISCLAFGKIKKEDIKINLIKSGKQILIAIKTGQENIVGIITTGQDNLIQKLNEPVLSPMASLTPDTIELINENSIAQPVDASAKLNDTTKRYSPIFGLTRANLGKNPLVIIDGKEYPSEVLYDISAACIQTFEAFEVKEEAVRIFGEKAGDGCVQIATKNGQIVYLTQNQKDNRNKMASIPKSQFYSRTSLKKDNDESYDDVRVELMLYSNGSNIPDVKPMKRNGSTVQQVRAIMSVAPTDKIGFLVDYKVYDEEEIKALPRDLIMSMVKNGCETEQYKPGILYQNKFNALFKFTTKPGGEYPSTGMGSFIAERKPDPPKRYIHSSMFGIIQLTPMTTNHKTTSSTKNIPTGSAKKVSFMGMISYGSMTRDTYLYAEGKDTIAYNTTGYKLEPTDVLIAFIDKLPALSKNNFDQFFIGGKIVNKVLVDNREYDGTVIQAVKNITVGNVSAIQLFNYDNSNPATINVITKPK